MTPSPVATTRLVVGTTGDYAPFSRRQDGRFVGLDIDLIETLAGRLGLAPVFRALSWGAFAAAFARADVDLIISGVTITAERVKTGAFSRPYLDNRTVVMGLLSEPALALEPAALRGRVLGVNRGGYLEAVARSRFPEAAIRPVADNSRLAEFALAGEFTLFMSDLVEARRFSAAYPVRVVAELEAQQHAIYFPTAQEALRQTVDAALGGVVADGTLAALAARHGIEPGLLPRDAGSPRLP